MFDNQDIIQELKRSTIYEVNLRQYTPEGTIAAFMPHLVRLKEMGIDILWFMPIHPIGIKNRKGSLGSYYCSRDFTELNPEYGSKAELKALIDQAHALGMKVILDWVANHAAWDNVWTIDHPEYFQRDEQGNFLSPYDWTDVIQIDHQNEAAHDALREAMCYWIREFDIDGFRADLAHLTPLHFWIKARHQTEAIKPGLIWLAETETPAYYQAFDIFYAWKWMHATEHFCKNDHAVHDLKHALHELKNGCPQQALQLFFTSNHDENTWNGTEFEKYGIFAKALSVFSFYYPHAVPLIYSGQEIPNTQRLQFFDKDELDWSHVAAYAGFYSILCKHRKKINLSDDLEFIDGHHRLLAFRRGEGDNVVWVFLNFSHHPIHHQLHVSRGNYRHVFSHEQHDNTDSLSIHLDPGGFVVIEKWS